MRKLWCGLTALSLSAQTVMAFPMPEAPVHRDGRVAQAQAPAPSIQALIDTLVGLKDHAARRAHLTALLAAPDASADLAARVGSAIVVIGHLERTGRNDASIVRLFLRAAMADDPAIRSAAVNAAQAGGDPPMAPTPGETAGEPGAGTTGSSPAAPSGRVVEPGPAVVSPSGSASGQAASAPRSTLTGAPRLEALRQYKQQRLVRDKLNFTVVSGGGAYTVGKTTTYTQPTVSSVATWGVFDGGGAPFTAKGFALAVGDEARARQLDQALTSARNQTAGLIVAGSAAFVLGFVIMAGGEDLSSEERRTRLLGGTLVMTTGAVLAPLGLLFYPREKQRQQFVAKYYTVEQADRLIEAYNARLREKLGLSAEDVQNIDLLGERPRIEVHPLLSPVSVGLQVRF